MDRSKINKYIANGKLRKAMEQVMLQLPAKNELFNQLLMLISRTSAINASLNQATIKREEYSLEINKIMEAFLALVDELKEGALKEEEDKGKSEKLLFLSAKPKRTQNLDIDNEYLQVRQALKRKKVGYEITEELDVSLEDFFDEINMEAPSIIHFAGHATKDYIVLTDDKDNSKIHRVPWQYLIPPFKLVANGIKCLVLHAAETSEIAKELSRFIPFVIGIKGVVPNEDALKFSPAFYSSLSFKTDFELAFDNATEVMKKRFQRFRLPISLIDYDGKSIEYAELGRYALYINGEEKVNTNKINTNNHNQTR